MKRALHTLRPADTADDAGSRSCLVLDASKLEQLTVDGPALRIGLREQASRLFPLRRLARIHVIGDIDAGFCALLHCAEQQIPVAFFSTHGKLRCQLYYPVFENGILSHWLEHIEFDPKLRQLYNEWLQLQMLHVLGEIGCRDGNSTNRLEIAEQRMLTLIHHHWSRGHLREARDWLQGILTSHLSQLIVQHGLSNQTRAKRRLLEDLLPTCELWLLYFLTVAVVENRKPPAADAQGMSRFYQQHAERIEYQVQRMLMQLVSKLEAII